jgi:hypothetical protein
MLVPEISLRSTLDDPDRLNARPQISQQQQTFAGRDVLHEHRVKIPGMEPRHDIRAEKAAGARRLAIGLSRS